MFAGMFEDDEEVAVQQQEEDRGALPTYYQRRAGHCASDMDFPP